TDQYQIVDGIACIRLDINAPNQLNSTLQGANEQGVVNPQLRSADIEAAEGVAAIFSDILTGLIDCFCTTNAGGCWEAEIGRNFTRNRRQSACIIDIDNQLATDNRHTLIYLLIAIRGAAVLPN